MKFVLNGKEVQIIKNYTSRVITAAPNCAVYASWVQNINAASTLSSPYRNASSDMCVNCSQLSLSYKNKLS